ncbi:MAG: pilin [Candidatus Gracilibacteria bacterium]|nr:pilin [Candidatus Gracilibacteria bacterium]
MGIFSGAWATLPSELSVVGDVSIGIDSSTGDLIDQTQSVGFRILSLAKIIISGFALIYLVMIGVYMVVFSENEERIKAQRKQIMLALIGFVFINIPGIIYQIFFSTPRSVEVIGDTPISWSSTVGGFFWDTTITDGFLRNLILFFQVFIFGAAVMTFTWGLFALITSAGNEEQLKKAKNRILYGTLGLLFLSFVRLWGTMITSYNFVRDVTTVAGKFFVLALYFAGPVAVFFLIWGGYYYITSGGDEERTKKGKNIIVNTFIATLILLASYSFLADLINFTF